MYLKVIMYYQIGGPILFNYKDEENFEFSLAITSPVCVVSLAGDLTYKNKKNFEKLLEEIKESGESHYIIQCREIGQVDQLGIQFLGRIYSTLKNVRKDKFAFCSMEEDLRSRVVDKEIISKDKILVNLKLL